MLAGSLETKRLYNKHCSARSSGYSIPTTHSHEKLFLLPPGMLCQQSIPRGAMQFHGIYTDPQSYDMLTISGSAIHYAATWSLWDVSNMDSTRPSVPNPNANTLMIAP